jgi:uncharacterized membrane protein YjjB (DUF3815 family)
VGIAFHLTLDPAEPVAADVTRFAISTFAAAAAAMMFALACYAPLRSLIAAALAGGVGWAAFGALTLLAPFGVVVATGLAAVFIGLASELFRRGTSIDRHVIILSGIIPLLPGLTAYQGFYQLASTNEVVEGLATITLALAVALALAAGVALGQLISRPRPAPEIPEPNAEPEDATPPGVNE